MCGMPSSEAVLISLQLDLADLSMNIGDCTYTSETFEMAMGTGLYFVTLFLALPLYMGVITASFKGCENSPVLKDKSTK